MTAQHLEAVRTFGIWLFGLFGSGLLGGMVADYFLGNPFDPGNLAGVLGGLIGMSAFGCASVACACNSHMGRGPSNSAASRGEPDWRPRGWMEGWYQAQVSIILREGFLRKSSQYRSGLLS